MSVLDITVLTLFPDMFPVILNHSLLGKAKEKGLWCLSVVDLRSYGIGPHLCIDDTAYGGGPGMVMRPDVVDRALADIAIDKNNARFIYLSPKGQTLSQGILQHISSQKDQPLILLCGRYEGIDQRLLDAWHFEEISLGDFVLCGGELPALALIEGCVRLLDGVVHTKESLAEESFSMHLLEYPHYTRPSVWKGRAVPDILLSGHHKKIAQWRQDQAIELTKKRRPDLWKKYTKCDIQEGSDGIDVCST